MKSWHVASVASTLYTSERNAISLAVTLAVFALSAWMLIAFKTKLPGMQFAENVTWIKALNIHYGMGVDGIAALLVFLTTLLGVIVIVASWHYVKERELGFFISLLLLQVGMVGVFCATDLFLFYVFWEAMLVPMYFIIGIWGGPRRIYAAIKFFLFTLIGSLLMLLAIAIYWGRTRPTQWPVVIALAICGLWLARRRPARSWR